MSAIYAVLDCSSTIGVEHLHPALALWDYAFASARHIFGDATGDPIANRIREVLQNAGEEGLTRTQVSTLLGRHASARRIGQALAQLRQLGIATMLMIQGEGRPVEVWISKRAT